MRLILVFSIILLTGCNDWFNPEQAMLEKYHQRLANVMDVSGAEIEPLPAITLPPRRELFHSLPRLTLGLLESYQLRQCGLFNLLAEKNSQLGKVQDAFHDLDYQASLLRTLNTCLSEFEMSNDERGKLDKLYEQKWNHLPTHLDNLLLASATMQKQLTASDWLSVDKQNQIARVSDAFGILEEMYATPNKTISGLPDIRIVQYQEVLEKSRLVGRLYYSIANSSRWLNETTQLLEQNQSKIICGKNRDITKFRYLNNVFQSIYVEEVQPYLAYLDSTYQRLNRGVMLVEERLALHNEGYRLTDAHNTFREKTLEHVKFWQSLFKRCGVSVGKPSN
ncbi:DUF3080 domain-containing protein [Vibrio sp. EA2]|uniref:DUF3080 domain-containing protein n=1 Tax=Vibrio sp. EA2 TaxID=3079860 RepID=UPI002949F531|nr:DUF3080 domain-containing protein [Vibrio sp. EA2]MDV6251001.1 DUF3080 domain-containing protein [Vibrio sp. EA2]